MKKTKFFLNLVFLFFISISYSQNYIDILNARWVYFPGNEFKTNGEKVSLSYYSAGIVIPFELKNENSIGLKTQYENFKIRSASSTLKELNLHSLKFSLFLLKKIKESNWSAYLELTPKINSDFKNISINHFQVGGIALFFYEKSTSFLWQAGIYYNQETYGPFIIPLLGFA